MSKIISGWGDWMFYGHATGHGAEVAPWWLIDLHEFRAALARGDKVRCGSTANGDGTHFHWYDVRSFKPTLLVAEGGLSISPALIDDDDDPWIDYDAIPDRIE